MERVSASIASHFEPKLSVLPVLFVDDDSTNERVCRRNKMFIIPMRLLQTQKILTACPTRCLFNTSYVVRSSLIREHFACLTYSAILYKGLFLHFVFSPPPLLFSLPLVLLFRRSDVFVAPCLFRPALLPTCGRYSCLIFQYSACIF